MTTHPPPTARTLAVASPKGGVGKSTIAVTLAEVAARYLGLKVLVVEGDENHSALTWMSRGADRFGADVAEGTPAEVAQLRHATGYDLIVVDLPGGRGPAFRAVLLGADDDPAPVCDYLLVPSQESLMDLRPVTEVLVAHVRPLGIPHALVLSKVPPEAVARARTRQDEVRVGYGIPVASTVVRRFAVVEEAFERDRTVLDIPGGSHSTARRVEGDFLALAAETFDAMGFDVRKLRRLPSWASVSA